MKTQAGWASHPMKGPARVLLILLLLTHPPAESNQASSILNHHK